MRGGSEKGIKCRAKGRRMTETGIRKGTYERGKGT